MDPEPLPPAPDAPTVPTPPAEAASAATSSPPRAFTQGVGTLYQFVGVTLFVVSMLVCRGSGLISKEVAERRDLMAVGWTVPVAGGDFFYSAQRALAVSVPLAVFFGIALSGLGLGLQAQGRRSPYGAVAVTAAGTCFWAVQSVFFATALRSVVSAAVAAALAAGFAILLGFAVAAWREMRRDPPPPGHEILPADYKVPYSHLHQDPPEVRLARELDQRRERLAVQHKELEMLEARLKRKLGAQPGDGDPPPSAETGRPS